MVRLGASIEETGMIPEAKLREAAACVAEFAAVARSLQTERLQVLVTSPARQASNGDELVERLGRAARVPVSLLSADEEGRLAYAGALSRTPTPGGKLVAVCDVGGGSSQVTIGTREEGPAWTRSIEIGSLRLTSRFFSHDPPGLPATRAARDEVVRLLDGLAPPPPHLALAVGGTARALRRLTGAALSRSELDAAVRTLASTPRAELEASYDLDPGRAQTLLGGAIILAAIRERLGVALAVARGGLREGAALELAARRAAA